MTERYRVCALDDLQDGKAQRFEAAKTNIAVVRVGDDVFAIGDTCSHANYSLSEGEVFCEDRTIECWKHGSAFSLRDGLALNLPATRPVPTYKVELEDGDVYVVI